MCLIDTSDLVSRLKAQKARRVALQFPAGLKRKAFPIARTLKQAGFEVIVSGDPCYGACDLAEGAAVLADVLVHFGHAPLGKAEEGIIYEVYSCDFDVTVLEVAIPLLSQKRIGLVTTVQHVHLLEAMAAVLARAEIGAVIAPGGGRTPIPGQVLGCSFEAARATGATEILFVGTGLFHPIGIQLATGARVVALDPYSGEARIVDASRLLRKRFAVLEKARAAESFGVILSTKSGQQRCELARRLADLSDRAVIVAMGEVTPDELLNLGFDAYVNTACPRLAYDDQIRWPVPVLSPQEFEILCGIRSFDDYQIDAFC